MDLKHMEQFRRSRELIPSNRLPASIERMAVGYSRYSLSNLIYSALIDAASLFVVPSQLGLPLELDLMGSVALAEILFLIELQVISTDLHFALVTSNLRDQSRMIGEINGQLVRCRLEKEAKLVQWSGRKWLAEEQLEAYYRELNESLLRTHLRYRIFAGQLVPVREGFRAIAATMLCLMFGMPLSMRLMSPYLDMSVTKNISLLYTVACTIFCDLVLVPLCRLHQLGQMIYRSLFSLGAHAVELMERTNGRVYSEPLLSSLSRELSDPDQFATRAFGLPPHLLEPGPAPLLARPGAPLGQLRGQLLGERLDDPLGQLAAPEQLARCEL